MSKEKSRLVVRDLVRQHTALRAALEDMADAIDSLRGDKPSSAFRSDYLDNLVDAEAADRFWVADVKRDERKSVGLLLGAYLEKKQELVTLDGSHVAMLGSDGVCDG